MTRELARGDSLAAGEELVTGSKVPSDLLQLKSGQSENWDFTRLFILRTESHAFSMYNTLIVNRRDVNRITVNRALYLTECIMYKEQNRDG